jgi:hypothetical protein
MPEWYLVIAALAALSALGLLWTPLLLALPLLAGAIGVLLVQAGVSAARASFTNAPQSFMGRLKLRSLTTFLHILQPLARLRGRLRYGLTPWRWRGMQGVVLPWPRRFTMWDEQWRSTEARLQAVEAALQAGGVPVCRGGDYDRWDLEVRGGVFGTARLLMAIEEHGAGRQLVRFRTWPRCSVQGLLLTLLSAALTLGAALDHVWTSAAILGIVAILLATRIFQECAAAMDTLRRALKHIGAGEL